MAAGRAASAGLCRRLGGGKARRRRRHAARGGRGCRGAGRLPIRSPGCSTSAAATWRIRRSPSASPCCAPMPRPSCSWTPARSRPRPARISATQCPVRPREALPAALQALAGRTVRVDPEATPAWFAETLRAAGATIAAGDDPCRLPRACKNPVEQAGRPRRASARCGGAGPLPGLVRRRRADRAARPRVSAAERLLAFRREVPLFQAESFPAISGAGEHGAIIHYRATRARATGRSAPDECYLIDSGGQFLDGTTDVTRTLWTGPGPAPAEPAGPLHPRAAGPYRAWRRCASRRASPGRISTPSPGARCGRRGSTTTTAPATASAASCRCMRGRPPISRRPGRCRWRRG